MTTGQRWFKNAIIYSLSVEHFFDENGDGHGDLPGLERRLDYITALGADCIWLLPINRSPRRDFGYDVSDWYSLDPYVGHMGDLAQLTRSAHERNMRLIVDLSFQHTSVDHPWFQQSREDRNSPFRDFYIWRDELPPREEWPEQIVWTGEEQRPWTYDEQAEAWYQHRFYWHEPDLNVQSAAVRDEMRRLITFWLQLGIDGIRIDAGSHLTRAAAPVLGGEETAYLRELRSTAAVQRPDAVLMVEADIAPEQLATYFEGGDGGLLLFNFFLDNYLMLALARDSAAPLRGALERLPVPAPPGQWANFLRNHDELDLERLSDDERQEVFDRFAPEPEMRIYGRGIRRRLAPMLDGDQPRLRLAFAALLSLPGAPVILYGDELGMGDDLSLADRSSVRLAMQWSDTDNVGFSRDRRRLPEVPYARSGAYGADRVNAVDERRNESSLFNWLAAALRARRESPHIGWGAMKLLETDDEDVLALRHDWSGECIVILTNFARQDREVRLGGIDDVADPLEFFADREYESCEDFSLPTRIAARGYRWFEVTITGKR